MPVPHQAVWIVRAGRNGEDEARAFSDGLAIIGFRSVGDLSGASTVDDVLVAVEAAHPEEKHKTRLAWARQLWAFRGKIQQGDVAVLPAKTAKHRLNLGVFSGDYQYKQIDGVWRHTRAVDWKQRELARTDFSQDMLHSVGAFTTVCRITRNNAEARVAAVLERRNDPGYEEPATDTGQLNGSADHADDQSLDIAQPAHDEILAEVRNEFPDHQLARLVGAILDADGWVAHVSPPGPDGGADILAARGSLGLDRPTLCVQVKATSSKANVDVYRALRGSMTHFQAEQGLLVCWAGFTEAVIREARQHLFTVRL